jgi:NADPH-dependent 2,4-dienoyl-CoA reductase/sulfur reductase-like enzyme
VTQDTGLHAPHHQRAAPHWCNGALAQVIGVTPDSGLAKAAGLETNARGGIKVDDGMRTSDPHIWAVGDAVEVKDVVTGQQTMLPLAGPANRQGRISADVIMGRWAAGLE